ncbi:uncharacterized protein BO66DRAFT_210368 [Aspergillus aculeatinus CBS 121060]|uniref:Uncharacterized protein n=1 Tax=Aspergillus aculeatinus CBS 121060 TaxID=1448322 RepID=A0ACD1GW09_9EURO|nr:hypothetical protein BO66DRAFT_210368 [Aspergillus aculeatinus CBS 121060]RAH65457.1 hypothetical protein BO66DRAFT_210368 [Aspergillus aculeatinus CBS 121060]
MHHPPVIRMASEYIARQKTMTIAEYASLWKQSEQMGREGSNDSGNGQEDRMVHHIVGKAWIISEAQGPCRISRKSPSSRRRAPPSRCSNGNRANSRSENSSDSSIDVYQLVQRAMRNWLFHQEGHGGRSRRWLGSSHSRRRRYTGRFGNSTSSMRSPSCSTSS